LNKTAKSFLTRWTQSGDENSYISLTILAIKSIYTHWKQTLPNDTVSHLMHAWYDAHDKVNLQRMDKVGKNLLLSRINRAEIVRPQTAGNLFMRKKQNDDLVMKGTKKEIGMDGVIADRKKFLLRGNGNITGFYDPPEGKVSSYQAGFRACKSTKAIQRTRGNLYTSSIMTVTPDPAMFKREAEKKEKLKIDLDTMQKKLSSPESALKRAMNHAINYQQGEDITKHYNLQGSQLKYIQQKTRLNNRNKGIPAAYSFIANSNKTPMPVRIQNLMVPENVQRP